MTSSLNMHYQHALAAIKSRMAYRGDFFISFFIMLISETIGPIIVFLMYQNGATFPGWSLYEMLLLQSMYMLAVGLTFPFFFGMVWNTIIRVERGTYDILLLKPRSILHMTIVTGFDSEDLGKLLGGLVFFGIAIVNLPNPSLIQIITFLLLVVIMIVVMFSFALIMSGTGFVWLGGWRMYEIFHNIVSFGLYPKSIYSKPVQNILTYILPIAAITFLPASAILGKPINGWWITAIISVIFLLLSLRYWHTMLKRLTSAGG